MINISNLDVYCLIWNVKELVLNFIQYFLNEIELNCANYRRFLTYVTLSNYEEKKPHIIHKKTHSLSMAYILVAFIFR